MRVSFQKLAKTSLVLVYAVITAGALVRMTGSGMGCPDWPKCFGYYIPPTNPQTLSWGPNRQFRKGQVIIKDQGLQVANSDFITSSTFDAGNWKPYAKHDYAVFNVAHTWIEYLNRLVGALAGLSTLLLGIFSLRKWKTNIRIVLFSWLTVFGMGFQAWLGANVVYSILEPFKVTLHMVMALVIVALLLHIINLGREQNGTGKIPHNLTYLIVMTLVLTSAQIIMGTQVRQFVDAQIDLVGETAKNLWLQNPTLQFYVHRSLSILVMLLNGYIWFIIKNKKLHLPKINWAMGIIGLEVVAGITIYYLDFPFGSQPVHLVLAALLFGIQFSMVLEVLNARNPLKTS